MFVFTTEMDKSEENPDQPGQFRTPDWYPIVEAISDDENGQISSSANICTISTEGKKSADDVSVREVEEPRKRKEKTKHICITSVKPAAKGQKRKALKNPSEKWETEGLLSMDSSSSDELGSFVIPKEEPIEYPIVEPVSDDESDQISSKAKIYKISTEVKGLKRKASKSPSEKWKTEHLHTVDSSSSDDFEASVITKTPLIGHVFTDSESDDDFLLKKKKAKICKKRSNKGEKVPSEGVPVCEVEQPKKRKEKTKHLSVPPVKSGGRRQKHKPSKKKPGGKWETGQLLTVDSSSSEEFEISVVPKKTPVGQMGVETADELSQKTKKTKINKQSREAGEGQKPKLLMKESSYDEVEKIDTENMKIDSEDDDENFQMNNQYVIYTISTGDDRGQIPKILMKRASNGNAAKFGTEKPTCKIPGCFFHEIEKLKQYSGRNFKRNKDELTQRIYELANTTIFDDKLPKKLDIIWNKKMLHTAGLCIANEIRNLKKDRYARIHMSLKVCDSADRIRDTLIHEICHVASWLIDGVQDSHGDSWKFYAKKCNEIHPELPMITRCHNYRINYKIYYECIQCGARIGRYTKSLNTERFLCTNCKGTLVMLPSLRKDGTPIQPYVRPFAIYVKQNYRKVLHEMPHYFHGDVMKKLSKDYIAEKTEKSLK
ncbi:germ cell nuclear acidic protein isoform X2 [Perognathus longimembris pacificus]|uniref:germ cell nuclear acidic protein isoform X2 n=1 Tax=Perognathus longimembris pacificus TaxID=214514 RepID=UPI0020197862|nr:germ cell nuclear acidic protein isoform X2 [Perognathus longimembris pacificus]